MNDKTYSDWRSMSDASLLATIGKFIQSHRLGQNRSQGDVAKAAGISRSTLSLLERGEKVRMDSLIRVLRTLNLLHVMDAFQVKEQISPLEYAKLRKTERKRASADKSSEGDIKEAEW